MPDWRKCKCSARGPRPPLQVSEHVWVARVEVTGAPHGDLGSDVATYEFTMVQRVGGVYDGYW